MDFLSSPKRPDGRCYAPNLLFKFTGDILLGKDVDGLCGLVVRVSGYRYTGPGLDPRR